MRIINISDVHGDFETFDKALSAVKASDADVLAINGDLAGSVFSGEEKDYFVKALEALNNVRPQVYEATNGRVRTIHDTAEFLISNDVKADDELKKFGEDYLNLERKARESMLRQYQELRQRFDDLGIRVMLIPGNWDGKCIDEVLAHENLHNKNSREVGGVAFVGYGGARDHPIELPPDLTIDFNEDEAYAHLSEHEDAEIAIIHSSPRGFEGRGAKHPGEYSLLAYLHRNSPSLILTGHSHNPFINQEEETRSYVVNPGNLGRYQKDDFGTFLELELDNDTFVHPKVLYKVEGDSVTKQEL